jgi:penicillin-binding protein 2
MRKVSLHVVMPWLFVILTLIVGTFLNTEAQAKQSRQSSSKKKTTSKATKSGSSRAAKNRKSRSARRQTRRGRSSRYKLQLSNKEARNLSRKGGKLSTAEKRRLATSRSARRRRARARYLARLRALRARDAALRNIAASNILKDITTGEDPEIRTAALEALGGHSGTVVVMDPNNGRVYTIVNQKMALGSPVKPCSTVKLIVGLAALHESVFDPNEDVQISKRQSMNLTDAMARSNNQLFQVLGRLLGFERVINYAENFGFGKQTGINYPGEDSGFLPEEGEQETGLMSSHGENFGVTAIQLAAFTSAIANGGNLYVPHTPRTEAELAKFDPVLKRKIEMTTEDRLRLMSGMIGAVNFGTGKLAYNPLGQVAGKTGTCRGSRDKLGLFTSFSSVDNPRMVVTVITTGSTEAGVRAAAIAGKIYASISPKFFRERTATPSGSGIEISNDNPSH